METTIAILALCGSMVGVLIWIIKGQHKIIHNGLRHVQDAVLTLPCRSRPDCPEDD